MLWRWKPIFARSCSPSKRVTRAGHSAPMAKVVQDGLYVTMVEEGDTNVFTTRVSVSMTHATVHPAFSEGDHLRNSIPHRNKYLGGN